MSTPAVLPGSIAATRCDVVGRQQLRQLGLDGLHLAELLDVGELGGVDRPVLVLVQDQDVDDADRPCIDEPEKLRRHLAGEVLRAGRNSTIT
jgi:hypothetical protein